MCFKKLYTNVEVAMFNLFSQQFSAFKKLCTDACEHSSIRYSVSPWTNSSAVPEKVAEHHSKLRYERQIFAALQSAVGFLAVKVKDSD